MLRILVITLILINLGSLWKTLTRDLLSRARTVIRRRTGDAIQFSPIDLGIMERSQNRPGLRSPISKFEDMHFTDTVTDINLKKFKL